MVGRGRGRARGRGQRDHGSDHKNFGRVGRSPPRRQREDGESNRESQYCLFCKVQLSSVKLHNEHKESVVHKQKETLIHKAWTDGLQFCYTCERIFPTKIELDTHVLMARHIPLYRVEGIDDLMKESEKPPPPPPEEPPKDISDQGLRREKDNKVRNAIVMKLNNLCDDVVEDNHKKNYCDLCDTDCLNSTNFKIHQDSWRHRAEVDRKRDSERKRFEEEAERTFREADEHERIKVPSHLADNSSFHCEVCSVALSGETSYMQHLKGKKHFRQVAQMRRPYKCYVCRIDFNNEKEFGHHLQSRAHINKAFKKDDKSKPRKQKEEWVEKKTEKNEIKSDDREREKDKSRDRRDQRKGERKSDSSEVKDDRKVEIVDSPTGEGLSDLREKLQGKKIVITKTNEHVQKDHKKPGVEESVDPNKRARELEMEAKFKKLSREYYNDLDGLKERITREREEDIGIYQQYETTYNKLCKEEDFVRENLRVLGESDPSKEDYIRDMIRIQRDMREVRSELEIREMMIIKRETLFREKFPNSNDNKVVLTADTPDPSKPVVIDYHHGAPTANKELKAGPSQPLETSGQVQTKQNDDDLRIQLERERLLKRLGPELDLVDPTLREKLLSVIMDKEASDKEVNQMKLPAGQQNSTQKDTQMKQLADREKQLEKELADLKSAAPPVKKITKSLVPQYDDVEEKAKEKKRRERRRSVSSDSSSSSSSSDDSRYSRKKRRRTLPKSRDRSRKRRRSSSRDHRKKSSSSRRSREDDRKKRSERSERKRPVKITIQSRHKGSKMSSSGNPLPGDSGSEIEMKESSTSPSAVSPAPISTIPVIGDSSSLLSASHNPSQPHIQVSQQSRNAPNYAQQNLRNGNSNQNVFPVIPPQPRQQFSLWKNPANAAAGHRNSPKEDVWDIAFSGGQSQSDPAVDALNLFNATVETQSPSLPLDILKILKSVAPIIQDSQQQLARQPNIRREAQRLPGQPIHGVNLSPSPRQNVEQPVDVIQQPDSVRTEDVPGSTPGGRVRSILKKMKGPPPIEALADDIGSTGSPNESKEVVGIPGLDSTEITDLKSNPVSDTHSSRPLGASQSCDKEEQALYGSEGGYQETGPNKPLNQPLNHYTRDAPSTHGPPSIPGFGDLPRIDRSTDPVRREQAGSPWSIEPEKQQRLQDDKISISSDSQSTFSNMIASRRDDVQRNNDFLRRVGDIRRDLPPQASPHNRGIEKPYEGDYRRDRSPVGLRHLETEDPYLVRQVPSTDPARYREHGLPPVPDTRDRHLPPASARLVQRDIDSRNSDPRALDQKSSNLRALDQRGSDPKGLAQRTIDSRLLDPMALLPSDTYGRRETLPLDRYSELPPRLPAADRGRIDIHGIPPPPVPPIDDRPPVRRPGETEDEFYIRFERYYEHKRRHENIMSRDRSGMPRRLPPVDDLRLMRDPRGLPPPPIRDDPYRLERYDDRYRQPEDRRPYPDDRRMRQDDRRLLPDDYARERAPELVRDPLAYLKIENDRRVVELDHRRVELSRERDEREPYSRRVNDEKVTAIKTQIDGEKNSSNIDRGIPSDQLATVDTHARGSNYPSKPGQNPHGDVYRGPPRQQPPPPPPPSMPGRRHPPANYPSRYENY